MFFEELTARPANRPHGSSEFDVVSKQRVRSRQPPQRDAELFYQAPIDRSMYRYLEPRVTEGGAKVTGKTWFLRGKGSGAFQYAPLNHSNPKRLNQGINVEARWNFDWKTANTLKPNDRKIDIVVYLHGFGNPKNKKDCFLEYKSFWAGLEMPDALIGVTKGRGRPILALVPKGIYIKSFYPSGNPKYGWYFNKLKTSTVFNKLVKEGLRWLESDVLKQKAPKNAKPLNLKVGRMTLIAHSGGGAAMNNLLNAGVDPDVVICYDSTYGAANPIIKWATKKIVSDNTLITSKQSPKAALRIFYGYGSPRLAARQIKKAVKRLLRKQKMHCTTLADRYRIEFTTVKHGHIPKVYTGLLLDNITMTEPCKKRPGIKICKNP